MIRGSTLDSMRFVDMFSADQFSDSTSVPDLRSSLRYRQEMQAGIRRRRELNLHLFFFVYSFFSKAKRNSFNTTKDPNTFLPSRKGIWRFAKGVRKLNPAAPVKNIDIRYRMLYHRRVDICPAYEEPKSISLL